MVLKVFLTGANQGIGFHTASSLLEQAEKPVELYVTARSQEKLQETVSKLQSVSASKEHKVEGVILEVTDDEQIKAAASKVKDLDVLVNNAGVVMDFQKDGLTIRQLLQKQYDVNVFSVASLIEAFKPQLTKSKNEPAIINISSTLGSITQKLDTSTMTSQVDAIAYNSSKTALNGITAHYANFLRDHNVAVVSVCPGYCATNLNNNQGYKDPKVAGKYIAGLVLDRKKTPNGSFISEELTPIPW